MNKFEQVYVLEGGGPRIALASIGKRVIGLQLKGFLVLPIITVFILAITDAKTKNERNHSGFETWGVPRFISDTEKTRHHCSILMMCLHLPRLSLTPRPRRNWLALNCLEMSTLTETH